MREAVIVTAVRSAVGRARRGSLKDTRPDDFGAEILKEAIRRTPGLRPEDIEDVVIGNAMPEASQGMNLARIIVCRAGLPDSVPAMTINRFCSSGLNAISIIAERIISGFIDIGVAGGVESMTMVPMGGFNPSINPTLMEVWPEVYTPMGMTAENVCRKFGITREEMDQFAYESHMKAARAIKEGKFKDQIHPLKVRLISQGPNYRPEVKEIVFDTDEGVREDTTIEQLSKLKPVFAKDGLVTAGNSSQTNDGAAFLVLMSSEKAKELGIKPLAVFRYYTVAGVPPEIMGIGPVAAIRKLFSRTGLNWDKIDLIELNEAFAAQAVYCIKELGIPKEKCNVNGGAIALGHPLGCTGAKLATQLIYELRSRKGRLGIVSMCIGGGMGAAGLFEMVY
ncbi:MAG: thiolase family protein [Deltaproteobacteria bacterium]|nr:thiolase family protein [Deltaproteobacteria bacterium]